MASFERSLDAPPKGYVGSALYLPPCYNDSKKSSGGPAMKARAIELAVELAKQDIPKTPVSHIQHPENLVKFLDTIAQKLDELLSKAE